MITADQIKERLGREAAQLVQADMLVGLGTGSTAKHFIHFLAERVRNGLNIVAVATSERSHEQALAGGIRMLSMGEVQTIDLTVDGADEINPKKQMIKGGGGALLREKIIAASSTEMVVVVDHSKQVKQLGAFPLPVEIVPFGWQTTVRRIEALGYRPRLRLFDDVLPYETDNGNYIVDLHFDQYIADAEETHLELSLVTGVVETGLFLGMAGRVLVGQADGTIKVIH